MEFKDIPKYAFWKRDLKGSNITPLTYISHAFDLQDVLLVSYLFSPDFLEYDSLLFLKGQFSEEMYDQWSERLNGNSVSIQKVMNHIHISQIFPRDDINEDLNFEILKQVCEVISNCWRGVLASKYPSVEFIVEVGYDEEDFDPYITFWQI